MESSPPPLDRARIVGPESGDLFSYLTGRGNADVPLRNRAIREECVVLSRQVRMNLGDKLRFNGAVIERVRFAGLLIESGVARDGGKGVKVDLFTFDQRISCQNARAEERAVPYAHAALSQRSVGDTRYGFVDRCGDCNSQRCFKYQMIIHKNGFAFPARPRKSEQLEAPFLRLETGVVKEFGEGSREQVVEHPLEQMKIDLRNTKRPIL